MNPRRGYYKPDLNIHYRENGENTENIFNNKYNPGTYAIGYIYSGEINCILGYKNVILKKDSLVFIDLNTQYNLSYSKNNPTKMIFITLHPSIFPKSLEDKNFLMPFSKTVYKQIPIFDLSKDDRRFNLIKLLFEDINHCLERNMAREHYISKINSIISEIDMYIYSSSIKLNNSSDSIGAIILDYINHHYHEKITCQSLMDEFFLSKSQIYKILKDFTGSTLNEYLTELRITGVKNNLWRNMPLSEIAKQNGFSTYSTFYRAYLKKYKTPPTEELEYIKKQK